MRLTDAQLRQINYAWRNVCSSRLASDKELPERLLRELQALPTRYEGDDEALLAAVKTLIASATDSKATRQTLLGALKADFYRIMGDEIGLPATTMSSFSSMASLLDELDEALVELEAVEAGVLPAPDLDALFKIHRQLEPEEDPLAAAVGARHYRLALAERVQFVARRLNTHASQVELILNAKALTHELQAEALTMTLEEARLAGCYK